MFRVFVTQQLRCYCVVIFVNSVVCYLIIVLLVVILLLLLLMLFLMLLFVVVLMLMWDVFVSFFWGGGSADFIFMGARISERIRRLGMVMALTFFTQISGRNVLPELGLVGHTPSTVGTFREKFRKDPGNALRVFLELPLRVRLGSPKPYNSSI